MKQCTYCGKEYPDDATVCEIDRQPLVPFGTKVAEPRRSCSEINALIGPGGRWLIFAGIPMSVCAILFVVAEPHHRLEYAVGEKVFPYVLFFVPATIVLLSKVLYPHFPKHLVVPLGIVGWIIHFSILCWFFWFGPGALRF
jgi:hypothetical protein